MESIIEIVDTLITEANELRASDIHIDPAREELRVRLRIDGMLQEHGTIPKRIHSEVITRIKVLAGMRTDEHQSAQDGRFHRHDGRTALDVRVSIAPTYHGENAVLRLLPGGEHVQSLETLGFGADDRGVILRALARPTGMILATGPTGSGKTTTLYSLVSLLNRSDVSIVTIEDPIEYAIENIKQLQVNQRAGLTFGSGLRSLLRQDPNIIMVGEIRDRETAGIAVNTALTGHLLLSTLHTNNAATTLPRLLDMGVDAYLVASTFTLAIGQRLARRLCECKEPVSASAALAKSLRHLPARVPVRSGEKFFASRGCERCLGRGYRGRICLSEVLATSSALQDAIMRKAPASELQEIAATGGMTTMLDDGLAKVRAGQTTVEEVLRVIIHE